MYRRYRGKDRDTNQWVYGCLYQLNEDDEPIIINDDGRYYVDRKSIGICINYKDGNGTDIYSGDIVKFADFSTMVLLFDEEGQELCALPVDGKITRYVNGEFVHYGHDDVDLLKCPSFSWFAFMLKDVWGDFGDRISVIGNIIDNEELLNIFDYQFY